MASNVDNEGGDLGGPERSVIPCTPLLHMGRGAVIELDTN
jgi:hypothetical protein